MAADHVLAVDLAKVWRTPARSGFVTTIGWGDPVTVLSITDDHVEVRVWNFVREPDGSERAVPASGFIAPPRSLRREPRDLVLERSRNPVLKADFVDVQQGDGSVLETPSGKVVLIDGGENQLYSRYLAGRFRRTSATEPFSPDAIVVTHGDADHFAGLTEIRRSETHATPWKRLFLAPRRILHNGLVKRPSKRPDGTSRPDDEMLGPVTEVDGEALITGLVDDVRQLPDSEMNAPFRDWKATLEHWAARTAPDVRRIRRGDAAFDFLDPGVDVEVLGPIETEIAGVRGLPFLGSPPRGPRLGVESSRAGRRFAGRSASHTINGHSIILRVTYGGVRILLTGDLTEEASSHLLAAAEPDRVQAEVFKAPHHGSADFDPAFIAAVAPVVSIVSSGDESRQKEYIHPRATLVGALGRYSRVDEPLVFVTELVAFFETRGWTTPEFHRLDRAGIAVISDGAAVLVSGRQRKRPFFAFDRAAFGLVRVRTDGQRLLVFTDSGHADLKEAYAYTVDGGVATPAPVLEA